MLCPDLFPAGHYAHDPEVEQYSSSEEDAPDTEGTEGEWEYYYSEGSTAEEEEEADETSG